MKIALAQTRPVTGDIAANIERHLRFINAAASDGAGLIVFPELSITGYEPALAQGLAIDPDDRRFDVFQHISDARHITVAVGAPTRSQQGVCISLLLFQPRRPRRWYSKMHLHSDEEPFFVPGRDSAGLIGSDAKVALAICYELSVPEHAANASKNGAEVYIASVAKTASGVDKAIARLCEIARQHSMTVLMSNCIGLSDGCEMAGSSSAISKQGVLLSQLDDASEGILILDTQTQDVLRHAADTTCH